MDTNSPDISCPAPVPAESPALRSTNRLGLVASAGSILSAFLATACCVGPLIFALLGLGGAGLLIRFEPYRPYFIVLTVALLGTGFFFTYRRPTLAAPASDGAACACPAPRTNRLGRIMLWVATVLVGAFLLFPYLVPILFG